MALKRSLEVNHSLHCPMLSNLHSYSKFSVFYKEVLNTL